MSDELNAGSRTLHSGMIPGGHVIYIFLEKEEIIFHLEVDLDVSVGH